MINHHRPVPASIMLNGVKFTLINNGTVLLNTDGSGNLLKVISGEKIGTIVK